MAVALVRKLGTRFGRPMNVEAAYFADSLYNAWQMEYKSCRIGILLVVSVIDREVSSTCATRNSPPFSITKCWAIWHVGLPCGVHIIGIGL